MINFEDVSKFRLSGITLSVPKGETVGLVGASGAGKTTLIKLACGLLAPDSGRVFTLGKDPVRHRGKYASDISALITGVPLLESRYTLRDSFEMIAAVYRLTKDEFSRRYRELSERLGFSELTYCRAGELSLGQRMRARLAAALMPEPELLLLDEPYAGLDECAKDTLREMLTERTRTGMTVLVTSNELMSVSRLCTRLAVLDAGRLVFYGSLSSLQSRFMPINRMSVRFSGCVPFTDDLPVKRYSLDGDILTLEYDSNHITAAQITEFIMKQTEIAEISIHKPDLEDIISGTGDRNELYRGKKHQQDL